MEPISLARVFVASPNDVDGERRIVQEICAKANIVLGDSLKMRVEPILWETHARSDIGGSTAQRVIFEQIDFKRLDVFVGILGSRFGTDTGDSRSGTSAEFERALELHNESARPHIMLYFAERCCPSDPEAAKGWRDVKAFQAKRTEGLFFRYESSEQFRSLFDTHLLGWMQGVAPPQPRAADIPDDFKIIHLTMSDFEWYHLLQLWKSDPHQYDYTPSLEPEMRSMERQRLISFKNQQLGRAPTAAARWDRLPRGQFFLCDIIELTEFGKTFIEWRRTIPPYNEIW